jgi:hypothetical protein
MNLTIDEIMFTTDGINPFRFLPSGGLGYTPYLSITGGALTDGEESDDDYGFDDDMVKSYLMDSLRDLNKRFGDLTPDEFEQMIEYQTRLEELIREQGQLDEDDEFMLNEIELSRNLIDKVLKDFKDRQRLIHSYDIERGFKKEEEPEYEEDTEEEEPIKKKVKKPIKKVVKQYNYPVYEPKVKKRIKMKGKGPIYPDINDPSKLLDENVEKAKEKGFDVDNIYELIEGVDISPDLTDEKKYKFIKEKLDELDELDKRNKGFGNKRDLRLEENIQNLKEYIQSKLEKEEYLEQSIEDKSKPITMNELYERNEEEAGKVLGEVNDTLRGNLFEKEVGKFDSDIGILQFIDKDKSIVNNSKEVEGYSDDFINHIIQKYNIKNKDGSYKDKSTLDKNDKDLLDEKILKFFPIDIIKDNTLWELKSFGNDLSSPYGQEIQITKLNGYVNHNDNSRYIMVYEKIDGKMKVKNIYYKDGENTIPILKKDGYEYYWMFNNKDNIGYVNPLKIKDFQPEKISGNIYSFGWKNLPESEMSITKKILIPNRNINIYPKTYSKKFNQKIKKFKI